MKADLGKIALLSTAASALVVIGLLALLIYQRTQGHLPLGVPTSQVLTSLTPGQMPLWGLTNTLYGLFFLLLLPVMWLAYNQVKDEHPVEGMIGLAGGLVALIAEALGRWWHPWMELPIVRSYYGASDPVTQRSLADLLANYDLLHQGLHIAAYGIVIWAVFMLILSLHRKSIPVWSGFLAFAMVPAMGPFPPLALLWAVPMVFIANRETGKSKGSSDSASARSRRRGGRTPAMARGRR